MKKIKVEEIFSYPVIRALDSESHLGFILNEVIVHEYLSIYGIDSTDYQNSVLSKIFVDNEFDFSYFIENSSEKLLSKIALFEYECTNSNIENTFFSYARHISDKYFFKWWKISEAITKNYKPLENYDMEEVRTPNLTENVKRNQMVDMNVHQESESGVYGFNSVDSNPTATGSGDTHTTGFKNKNETEDTKTNTGTESLTRHGNIGVTTSQQMLESEIVLREKHNLLEMIFKDIDSVLCLKVY